MATALTETVSQYIPTFEKVEAFNLHNHSSPDGAGGEESLGHSLVLTQPDAMSISSTSQRSTKSDKMQKKLDYEAGVKPKTNKRILRSLSKTFRSSSNSSSKEQPQSPKQQRPLNRTLSRTISQHEINLDNRLRGSSGLKSSNALRSSNANLKNSNALRSSNANLKASTNLKSSSTVKSPGLRPARKNSNANLKASSALRNSLRSSALAKTTADLNKSLAELVKTVDPLKKTELTSSLKPISEAPRSPAIRSPAMRSPAMRSPNIRRSSGVPRRAVPVPVGGSKQEAINVLLHDFEAQKQRALELTLLEHEIYKQEVAKYEEMLQKKQREQEAAIALANSIKDREDRLERLFAELDEKQKLYQVTEEELTSVSKEFESELHKQEADMSGVTSAAIRLKEAANRKVLKEQWKSDPVSETRYRLLQAQDDIRTTQTNITSLKKELGRLKAQASKGKSSDHRLREEMTMRENMRKTGQPKERGQYVRPKGAPKTSEKRAHMSRLEEEKAKRLAKKRTTDVADLIAQQAGVSRSRYGVSSPYRTGLVSSTTLRK